MKKMLIPLVFAGMLFGCGKPKPTIDIWTAAGTGNIVALQQNLAAGIDINLKEPTGGSTPLMVAALCGQTTVVTLLLEKGAKLDARNNDGSTALHIAAFFCQPEAAQLLLDRGADVTAKNNGGATPLNLVSGQFTPDLQNIYVYIAGYLHLPLDLEKIKRERPALAELLRKAGG